VDGRAAHRAAVLAFVQKQVNKRLTEGSEDKQESLTTNGREFSGTRDDHDGTDKTDKMEYPPNTLNDAKKIVGASPKRPTKGFLNRHHF